MMRRWLLLGGVLSLALPAVESSAHSVTFDLSSAQGSAGRVGNCLHFESECVNLTATAWTYDTFRSPEAFAPAALGQWATGLGVLNKDELRSRSPYEHQVDGVGEADYVLFLFDHPVHLKQAVVDPYGWWDTDVIYWSGMITSHEELEGSSIADLATAGYHATLDEGAPGADPRTVTFPRARPVNALLLGVPLAGHGPDADVDKFKIQELHVACIPEPSSLGLLLMGGTAWVWRWRRGTTELTA